MQADDKEAAAKRLRSHQGHQAKNKKRPNEQKSQSNDNFEQGGRLDDEAQDQRLNEEANAGRHVQKVEIELVDTSNTQTLPDAQNAADAQNEGADDLINYKGIYFNDNNEKYIDEATGAHFRHEDICQRLLIAKVERNRTDKELNISYSSQNYVQTEPVNPKQASPGGRQAQEKKYKRPVKPNERAQGKTSKAMMTQPSTIKQ